MAPNNWLAPLQALPTIKVSTPTAFALGLSVSYLLLVRCLRFRSLRKLERKHVNLLKDPYSMSYKTAQKIMLHNSLYEMPWMNLQAGVHGLLKTYGIASGTKLLVQTRQLTSKEKVGKRVEDTGVLLAEITASDIDSERAMRALSKVNWLHSRYTNRISNDEMLHTLSVFALEAIHFIDRWEWRKLTDLEKVARFVFWREIGLRMGIRDIPESVEAFEEWTETYEKTDMVFAETNRICMDTTVNMTLRQLPKWTHGFFKNIASVFLEKRALHAVGWPDPPRWVSILVLSTLHTRAWILRNLCLPRLWAVEPLMNPDKDGRIYRKIYLFEPWYIKDNAWTRWKTWLGSKGTLSPGAKFKSDGYLPEELGPLEFETASKEPVRKQAAAMCEFANRRDVKISGCPFAYGDDLRWL